MRPGCIIIVHLDRAILAFEGATQGYVPPVVGCIGFKKKVVGCMRATERNEAAVRTCARGVALHAWPRPRRRWTDQGDGAAEGTVRRAHRHGTKCLAARAMPR
jgi:hypothetical protein